MPFEEVSLIIYSLRRKLLYVVAIFAATTLLSFQFMGELIKKIEYDMFFRLNLADKPSAAAQLSDISSNLSNFSRELAINNPAVAENLSAMSSQLLNISSSLNLNQPVLVYLTPMEVLMLEFKMSIIFGFIFTLPVVLYFMFRGLKGRLKNIPVNKSLILLTIASSIMLFIIGAAYAYFLMLPLFLRWIYQDAMSLGVNATFSIYSFIYFIVMTTAIMGVAFELPVIMVLLVKLGVTSRRTLSHYRRHAYVILLIIAAWVTPDPTMFSQIMMTIPFVVLYEVTLIAIRLWGK
jgi:sec-independent protein translocase protein TatC